MKPLVVVLFILLALMHGAFSAEAPAAAEPAPVKVITRPAEEKAMPRYLRVTGQLRGSREAQVAADATGKVVEALVERGSVVKKDDVLLKLDNSGALLSLREAEASVASAQLKLDLTSDELKRNEPLASSKAISGTDFLRFKNDRASAESSLAASVARRDIARKAVDDAIIRAPFAGTVAERLVDLGEYVRQDSQVVHLVAIDKLHLWLNIPETSAGAIKEGQQVGFNVPAFPRDTFTGVIRFIGAAVRESARDLIVEAEVPNADGRLKPGMFAEARIALREDLAVTVPAGAVKLEGSTRKVFVVLDGRIEERFVEIGETKDGAVEIRRGVNKGEAVVTTPTAEAVDGVKVSLAN
ncbi:MAG: efflux transporter periplasmic adaptor subunit [Verrucomicrobiaceae bacterium]|nr:efflux transporter periplasmic adaptor subunit [Verrucomicrobiaceae bacterium]